MAAGPVLLGLADGNMSQNDDKICGWSTNKIGGTPVSTYLPCVGKTTGNLYKNWLLGAPSHYPACFLCKSELYFVCQIYCPLSDSIFHRVLYVFGCPTASCWGKNESWRVLRCQAKDSNFVYKKTKENESQGGFEVDDWCDDAEDWGNETDDVITGLEQFTGNLKLSENKQEEKDSESGTDLISTQPQNELSTSAHCAPHFAPLYISVIEADPRQNSAQLTKHEKKLLSEYQQQEGIQVLDLFDTEGVKGWTGETYESASVKYGDKAFHKFNKHLQAYPQQCLRYQWNGTPISMVTTKNSELLASVPPCQHCGAGRVFELQFMPALVGTLKCIRQLNSAHSHNTDQNSEERLSLQGHCESLPQMFEATGETIKEDSTFQVKQRRIFLAAVNRTNEVTIEFGTVMVFTCSQSCWKDLDITGNTLYLEEFCLVEADPDLKLFQ